jgi:hypothetical protein
MTKTNRVFTSVVAVAATFVVILSAVIINAKKNAEALLSELQNIQMGQTGFDEVRAIAMQYSSHVRKGTGICMPSECNLTLGFENLWLQRLHLAPRTTFGAVLLVRNGRIYYVNTAMTLDSGDEVISASTTMVEEDHGQPSYSVVTKRGVDNRPWQVIVHLTPRATVSQQQRAFQFNLACLYRLGGCKDSSNLLPSVWQAGDAYVRPSP